MQLPHHLQHRQAVFSTGAASFSSFFDLNLATCTPLLQVGGTTDIYLIRPGHNQVPGICISPKSYITLRAPTQCLSKCSQQGDVPHGCWHSPAPQMGEVGAIGPGADPVPGGHLLLQLHGPPQAFPAKMVRHPIMTRCPAQSLPFALRHSLLHVLLHAGIAWTQLKTSQSVSHATPGHNFRGKAPAVKLHLSEVPKHTHPRIDKLALNRATLRAYHRQAAASFIMCSPLEVLVRLTPIQAPEASHLRQHTEVA